MTDMAALEIESLTAPLARGEHPMARALCLARLAANEGEVPVGAVITDPEGQLISAAHNLVETGHDPLGHAELLAIRAAAQQLGDTRLAGCHLYVTLEPCVMCAGAISHARLARLYYGAADPKGGAVDHGPRWFEQATCLHRPEIYGGIMEQESAVLLRTFFAARR